MKRLLCLLVLLLLLPGCAMKDAPVPLGALPEHLQGGGSSRTDDPALHIKAEAEAMASQPPAVSVILEPEASGTREERCEEAVVDYSHAEEGYIMVCYLQESQKRLKVLLKGPSATYQYNLTPGQWAVLPLSDGNGSYQTGIYRNTSGSKYAAVMAVTFDVELQDEFAPFLRPNQYVNYLEAPQTMALGAQLCAGLESPLEKVAAVYDYVVEALRYDDEKASSVKSGYLPVLDQILAEKKGICFDYAALMTAMLRGQEVPCKLVVGYAGSSYHAWISVWTEENGWVDGVIFFDGHAWKRMDPTFASSGEKSEEIMDFIEHGSYKVKYLY